MTDDVRLYRTPSHLLNNLNLILDETILTIDEFTEVEECSRGTAYNRIHDIRCLDLVSVENNKVVPSEAAWRVAKFSEYALLEGPFSEFNGVSVIREQIDEEPLTMEAAGRIINFKTNSDATKENTFKEYGRVYGKWLEFLDWGYFIDGKIYSEVPENQTVGKVDALSQERGAAHPKVWPDKLLNHLEKIEDYSDRAEIAQELDISGRSVGKIQTTARSLGFAVKSAGGYSLTERGHSYLAASDTRKEDILREALLEIPMIRAYCNRLPDSPFDKELPLRKVAEEYDRDWNETTIETKTKRIVGWLIECNLLERSSRGKYRGTNLIDSHDIDDP